MFWFRIALTWWWVISFLSDLKVRFMLINTLAIQNCKHYACATLSCPPEDRFHTETGEGFAFTWYRCEIYRSKILAPVQQPGWTHAGVTRVLWCYHVISMGRFMAVFMGYSVTGFLSPYRERFRFCSSAMTRESRAVFAEACFFWLKTSTGQFWKLRPAFCYVDHMLPFSSFSHSSF